MRIAASATIAALGLAGAAHAHYGMIIPSAALPSDETRQIALAVSFSHPFERLGMDLARPVAFGVTGPAGETDLLEALEPAEIYGHDGFTLDYGLERPGAHVFHMEPQPYWEPAEDAFIVHYTKTYVAAFGDDEGWDAELGLKTEIVPLSKPFGLWAGNVFQGIVKLDGEPVPFAEVEVEHLNESGAPAPSDIMVTQTIKADQNGVFTYAAPVDGWWGFAALSTAEETLEHEGVAKPIELGAVLWVHFEPWGQE